MRIDGRSGYDHPEYIDGFVNYAKICIARFGDRVPFGITFNEPNADALASGNNASARNVLIAHAEVVKWYRETVNGTAKSSMKTVGGFGIPLHTDDPSDISAANRYQDYHNGHIANPLYLGLPAPQSITHTVTSVDFIAEELQMIHGTSDFYAFDIYTVSYVTAPEEGIDACARDPTDPLYPECVVAKDVKDGWAMGYKSNCYPEVGSASVAGLKLDSIYTRWQSKG